MLSILSTTNAMKISRFGTVIGLSILISIAASTHMWKASMFNGPKSLEVVDNYVLFENNESWSSTIKILVTRTLDGICTQKFFPLKTLFTSSNLLQWKLRAKPWTTTFFRSKYKVFNKVLSHILQCKHSFLMNNVVNRRTSFVVYFGIQSSSL